MIIAAITNSWAEQLLTTDLPRLVERARRRGAAHVELRQSYLGEYEEGGQDRWRPAVDKIARLARTFPTLTFNLAIAYPCLTKDAEPASTQFQTALEAAREVGPIAPRLRIVDTSRYDGPWRNPEDLPSTATGVAELARESARQGVQLSIENSGQPIRSMALVVHKAREALTAAEARFLGLCIDPVNSMRADPTGDPIDEIEALPLDHIHMVHFKQTRNGQPHPTVDDGDLDYPRLIKTLRTKGYDGLAVLEIPAGERVFENFQESVDYLGRLTLSV